MMRRQSSWQVSFPATSSGINQSPVARAQFPKTPVTERAGHTPGLRLLGVSTIGGNQTLVKVTHNALDVLDAVGLSHIGNDVRA